MLKQPHRLRWQMSANRPWPYSPHFRRQWKHSPESRTGSRQPFAAAEYSTSAALTTNTSILTAIGNDYDYSEVFSRQVRALVKPGDCVAGISTSGRSKNVLNASESARDIGAVTIGFTGGGGSPLRELCDECFIAESASTPRIQECHLLAWHLICNMVEKQVVTPS